MLIKGKYRCINCFNELNDPKDLCSCGYNNKDYKVLPHWLFPGTMLDNRYYVGRVIGEGGFGITYVGYDINLEMKIAIKEFFLSGINSRNATVSNEIATGIEEREEMFTAYREKFINEARLLAKFNKEEGIVTIINFFKSNNTAYIIMEFVEGENLKEYLKSKGTLSVDEVLEIFLPIMDTLDRVHATKLIHRDISPDNIIFSKNGDVKLIDFGAARDVADENKSLSVVLKHGFAPPEQYQTHGNQGPWTDVYAISATIYKCLTGKTPPEAMDRMMGSVVEPAYIITNSCSKDLSDIIMKGLELQIANRYQSMHELSAAINGIERQQIVKDTDILTDNTDEDSTVLLIEDDEETEADKKSKKIFLFWAVGMLVVALFFIYILLTPEYLQKNSRENVDMEILQEDKYETVKFGNYKGFTEWLVLEKQDDRKLLVSKDIIKLEPYQGTYENVSWEKSTLFKWLNNDYYDSAFSVVEKELICGNNHYGRVFLLNEEMIDSYFANQEDRVLTYNGKETSWWIDKKYEKNGIIYEGCIDEKGNTDSFSNISNAFIGVRPAIYIYDTKEQAYVSKMREKYSYLAQADIGDTVEFGNYNGSAKWRVLEKDGKYELLVSEGIVKETNESLTSINGWLNGIFYSDCFSEEEKKLIVKTQVNDNTQYMYLLNKEEAHKYFSDDDDRKVSYIGTKNTWWLRAAEYDRRYFINEKGEMKDIKQDPSEDSGIICGLRPAFHIDISMLDQDTSKETIDYSYYSNAKVGDIIEFGKDYSEWLVLKKKSDSLMLISKEIVDIVPYNESGETCIWNDSSLRKWLNEDYYGESFTREQKNMIMINDVESCEDKVYILSKKELDSYLNRKIDKVCTYLGNSCWWWLRDREEKQMRALFVDSFGDIHSNDMKHSGIGVRPVITIDISNSD